MPRQPNGANGRSSPVTIRAVADRAHVSPTTVSHALSGKGRVAAETRERVIAAVRELGYVANREARALKTGQTMTLLAVLPGAPRSSSLHSAFISDLLIGAAETALEAGYLVTVAGRSSAARSPALSSRFDGAVVVDPPARDPLLGSLTAARVPVVTIGRVLDRQQPPFSVDNDYADGILKVLRHLKDAGFKAPALLTTRQRVSYALVAIAAFKSWAADAGVRPRIEYVKGYPDVENGRQAATRLLRQRPAPDAVIAATEPLSVGALRAAQGLGLAVPDDVGLASIHDSERLRAATVPITALDLRATELGRKAFALLISILEHPGFELERSTVVTTELIVRDSTARRA